MGPRFAPQDTGDGRLAKPVFGGQRLLRDAFFAVAASDFSHDSVRGTSLAVAFAARALGQRRLPLGQHSTPLGIHVVGVGLDITQEQMVRPNTGPNIAVVEHPQAGWDVPEVQAPRDTMRLITAPTFAHADAAVPTAVDRAYPQPAPIRLLDFGPETGSQWDEWPNTEGSLLDTPVVTSDELRANTSAVRKRPAAATGAQGNLFLHRGFLPWCHAPGRFAHGAGAIACPFYATPGGLPMPLSPLASAVSG